ncbi:MAG: leucyl/phenylalanyl-tRNA--protein transferase [Calditrichaeota bacterium]|nr:leucyl/phenylalanyl-tRNA--protein transferase [Calditrichota bacterium]MCB9087535.1 leucyl/phenylalanyl-tRNA--protein transferase [Calditrichia bacterium]
MIRQFPPLEFADPEYGLLAIGGDLEVGSLELAYRSGIFPWPERAGQILWFAPPQRAVLFFEEFHIPRRLQRHLRHAPFTFRIDQDFPAVIRHCAASKNRGRQRGTWIIPEMIPAYIDFHRAGFAQSFEAYNPAGKLVGGLYGVRIGRYFAGESMFYLESNASKFALVNAVSYLRQEGLEWMDIQMLTPLLAQMGAREIPRDAFMKLLRAALA